MAKVKAIKMQYMKGTSGLQELSGADVFVGPNGAGKSTRLQALQGAMLGYIPVNGKGKKPSDTFNRYSSDERSMAVGLVMEGFEFMRQFNRTTKLAKGGGVDVKVSEALTLSPVRGERTETEKKARVTAEIGSFAVMLDFSEFTSMTDSARRDFIYGLSNGQTDAWDKERIREYVTSELLTIELEVKDPDLHAAVQKAIDDALDEFREGMTIDEGLASIRGYVKSQWQLWKQKAGDAEGAIRQMAELKNKSSQTDRNLEANKKELADSRKKLIDVEAQLARDTEKKKAIDRRTARLQELDELIKNLQTQQPQPTDWIDQKIAEIEAAMDHTADTSEYERFSTEKKEAEEQLNGIRKFQGEINQDVSRLTAEVASIQKTLDTIEQTKGVCVIQHQIKCDKDFSSYISHAEKEIANRNYDIENFRAEIDDAEKRAQGLVQKIADIEKRMSEVMRQTQQRQQENAARQREIQKLNGQKQSILNAEQRRLDDLQRFQTESQDLLDQKVEAIAPLDLLEVQRDELRNVIAELEPKIDEQEKVRRQLEDMRASLLSNKESEFKEKAFKSLHDALGPKGLQGEIVKTMLDPMREEIEHNLWTMGVHRKVFFQTESDTGQEVFQFGWIDRDGQRRNYDALSTGQQLMFMIAFLVTVIERANPPVKVLAIDNIEHLDVRNQRLLLDGLWDIRYRLDNILLAGVIDPELARKTKWTVHEIERELTETEQLAEDLQAADASFAEQTKQMEEMHGELDF